MQVFTEQASAQFAAGMRDDLRRRFPEETKALSDEQLAVRIGTGAEKAKCYGLNRTDHVRAYLELDIIYGPDFDLNPSTGWAGKILRNHRLTADDKLRAIEDHELFPGQEG